MAFRSHYGFDAFYCRPGVEGAHEKGGVEHEGGRFGRSHLVPVPEVDTLAELNEKIEQIEVAEDVRHIDNRPTSVGFDFDYEAPLLAPLPFEEFDIGLTLTPKVDKSSRINVRQNKYSVPARFIGTYVRVSLRADEVWVFERNKLVVRHPRLAGRYGFRDLLDHYLEILRHKPGALEHSTGLAAARESGQFTDTHDAFWAAARESRGRSEGTRSLIEVLLLHRRLPDEAVVAGMKAVLEAGSVSPDLVAIEARKAVAAAGGPPPVVIAPQAAVTTVAAEPDTRSRRNPNRNRPRSSRCHSGVLPCRRTPARTIAGRLRPVALCSAERLSMTQSTATAPANTGRWGSFGLPGQRGPNPSEAIDAACRSLGLSGVRALGGVRRPGPARAGVLRGLPRGPPGERVRGPRRPPQGPPGKGGQLPPARSGSRTSFSRRTRISRRRSSTPSCSPPGSRPGSRSA